MASRYGNQDDQRRGRGSGRSSYGRGSDRPLTGSSRFGGGYRSDFDRDESYFGGGNQGYGEGYAGGSSESDFDTFPRSFETGSFDRESAGRRSTGPGRRADFPDRYSSGYESDYERGYGGDRSRRSTSGGYSGRSGYSGSNYGRGQYGSNYPESESGYSTRGTSEGDDRGWWDKASDEVSSWFGDEEAERRRQMDERREGSFRGRGPRNYTRSDVRIREDINDRLTDYAYIDASDIDVQVTNSEVILTGTVDSRYDKRLAEDIAEDVSGVKNVENRIRVNRDTSAGDWSYSDTAGHNETGRSTEAASGTQAGQTTAGTNRGTTATGTTGTTGTGRSKSASG
jgi:osmotically-inducible protein OsmY